MLIIPRDARATRYIQTAEKDGNRSRPNVVLLLRTEIRMQKEGFTLSIAKS
jgi:hypothetical protein